MKKRFLPVVLLGACTAVLPIARAAEAGAEAKKDAPAWYEDAPSSEKKESPPASFEESFAKEKGVAPIPKGGWIKILAPGAGAAPHADDTVKVHYRGTLTDGTEFDSSYKRGAPATFPLKSVIACWTNGVPMMKVGGKAKLVCPSAVAYGAQGRPPVIPGGATLVFEIELLEIVRARSL